MAPIDQPTSDPQGTPENGNGNGAPIHPDRTPLAEGTGFQVQYVHNDGGGFVDAPQLIAPMTIGTFLEAKMPGQNLGNFTIRVNRYAVASNFLLSDGDRITVTPIKVAGA